MGNGAIEIVESVRQCHTARFSFHLVKSLTVGSVAQPQVPSQARVKGEGWGELLQQRLEGHPAV